MRKSNQETIKLNLGTDFQVVDELLKGLEKNEPVYLVTVLETWGSAPRRPGALMGIRSDGRFVGSVSGGCIEDDLTQRVMRGDFDTEIPVMETYGIKQEQSQRVGLPCGGKLKVIVECIKNCEQILEIHNALTERKRISRTLNIIHGTSKIEDEIKGKDFSFSDNEMIKVFGPQWRMLLIGAGELSTRVAEMALTLDYDVTICDPRPEYVDQWQVKGARFTVSTTGNAVKEFKPDECSVVLALAHSSALDDDAIAECLNYPVFYLGALGSMGTQKSICRRLQKRGFNEKQISSLRGPVGLDIGSRTPAEIAVAIMADLIKTKNKP